MYNHSKILALAFLILLPIGFLVSTIPQETETAIEKGQAYFVISGWDFPDEYGQGIYGFFVGDNFTGEFLWNSGRWYGALITKASENTTFESDVGVTLGLDVRVLVNYTLLGLTHPDDRELGVNYIRLNVTVLSVKEVIFSQNNFTYDYFSGDHATGIWYYSQTVIFDFVTVAGNIYAITITYEVFW